ncbi:MAG: glycosyltransferase [Thermoleophilaceae bacterium]
MPRVSVITPAHNCAAFIGEAMRSVAGQTYDDWEMVVADDASTDDSAAIAEAFDPRVTVVRSERNVGPAAARNLALERAGGELVALLDADDYLLPEFLERQVGAYDRATAEGVRVGFVSCNARILTDNGLSEVTYHDIHRPPGELTLERLLRRNPVFVSSVFPRSLIDEVGPFDPEIRGAEDFDLWVRIMERGYRGLITPEPLAVYRRWSGAATTSQATAARSDLLAYEKALERGRLEPRATRIARRRARYNRAVQMLSTASPARILFGLPLLARVAIENPGYWPTWARGVATRVFRGRRREYAS